MCFNFCVLKVKEYFFFYFFLNQQKFKIKKKLNGLKFKKHMDCYFFVKEQMLTKNQKILRSYFNKKYFLKKYSLNIKKQKLKHIYFLNN